MSGPSCGQCGYSLVGLPDGAVCPECGAAVRQRRSRHGRLMPETLIDAPMWYLVQLARASMLLALAAVAATVMAIFAAQLLSDRVSPLASSIVWGVIGVAWCIGVYFSTEPRATSTASGLKMEFRRLRWVNRGTQAMWLVALGAGVLIGIVEAKLAAAAPGTAVGGLGRALMLLAWVDALASLIAFLGLVPLCVQLGAIAEWAQDDGLHSLFRGSGSALALAGLLSLGISLGGGIGGLGLVLALLSPFAILLFLGGMAVFVWSVIDLARASIWAINNAHNAQEVSDRRAERFREERARQQARLERQEAAGQARPFTSSAAQTSGRLDSMGSAGLVPVGSETDEQGRPLIDLVEPPPPPTPRAHRETPGDAGSSPPPGKIVTRGQSISAPRNYATGGEHKRYKNEQL
jgi:hypothetical protein